LALGLAELLNGDQAAARAAFDRALELDPQFVEARRQRAGAD
jgi:Tfp pilus assembly protein PilF